MTLRRTLAAALCLLPILTIHASAQETPQAQLLDVRKIWDQARHNAFTDLLYHDGTWYCTFREGDGHVSAHGALRVLTSQDGLQWTSAALITSPDSDLRDAKISVAPDGQLCLCGAGFQHKAKESESNFQSYLWYSKDGKNWGEAIPIGDPDHWIWRIVWHEGIGYGVGYTKAENNLRARLYQTNDGRNFTTLVSNMLPDRGYVNETAIVFQPDESALCLIRRDGKFTDALLGKAKPPYTDWKFESAGIQIGGPQMLQLPDGRIVVAGRSGARTQLWWLEPATGKLTALLTLPSGGDTSYPGLVWHDDKLWISYYSSHEGKTSIYLAQVKLP